MRGLRANWQAGLLAGLLTSGAYADGVKFQGRYDVRFAYSTAQAVMPPEAAIQLIDDEVTLLSQECPQGKVGAGATLRFVFPSTSLPRKDYQRIGDRFEALRSLLAEKHGIQVGGLSIHTGAWFDKTVPAYADHGMTVVMYCGPTAG